MKELRLYEYAIILQPRFDKDGEQTEAGEIAAPIVTVLAATPEQATLLANRAIPEKYMDRIERLTVAVRPF